MHVNTRHHGSTSSATAATVEVHATLLPLQLTRGSHVMLMSLYVAPSLLNSPFECPTSLPGLQEHARQKVYEPCSHCPKTMEQFRAILSPRENAHGPENPLLQSAHMPDNLLLQLRLPKLIGYQQLQNLPSTCTIMDGRVNV
jgi:hypothetical protein